MRLFRRRNSKEKGAELVEMAVVLPLLLFLIAGIVDFAFLLQSFEVVTNAAREGARIAVLPGYVDTDVQNRVAAYVASAGLSGTPTTTVATTTITPGGGGPSFTAKQVSVSYDYGFLFIKPMATLIGATFTSTKTFTARSVMRCETGC
jgi:Flp pilus assembly protein TadG